MLASNVVTPADSPTSALASAVPRVSCMCSASFSTGMYFISASRISSVWRGVPTPIVSPRLSWYRPMSTSLRQMSTTRSTGTCPS